MIWLRLSGFQGFGGERGLIEGVAEFRGPENVNMIVINMIVINMIVNMYAGTFQKP